MPFCGKICIQFDSKFKCISVHSKQLSFVKVGFAGIEILLLLLHDKKYFLCAIFLLALVSGLTL